MKLVRIGKICPNYSSTYAEHGAKIFFHGKNKELGFHEILNGTFNLINVDFRKIEHTAKYFLTKWREFSMIWGCLFWGPAYPSPFHYLEVPRQSKT